MNKKYSFKNLLENEIIIDFEENTSVIFNKIEIPMIQRDYAQGRGKIEDDKLKINEAGKRFLNSIFESLENNLEMEMDFVYGSVSEYGKEEYAFIPLDGQQRLTTLFLLHWYIGSRELEESYTIDLMNLLKKFTYSTRVSSRRFCELLCETKLSFKKTPSDEISNLSWFFKSYKKDPTIKAMLNMLDFINEKYSSNSNLFEKLEKLQFYILPLNGFNLTEDLYIKMNARGKQLTDFENFKADIIGWMKAHKFHKCTLSTEECTSLECMPFMEEVDYHKRKMPFYMSISQKMDNEWTDLFWQITKDYNVEEKDEKGNIVYQNGKLVDPLFMRFFYRYFLNYQIINSKETAQKIEESSVFKYFYEVESSIVQYVSFDNFLNNNSYEVIKNIEKVFDEVCIHHKVIKENISPSWESKDWMFYNKDINLQQRIAFFATTMFIERNDYFDPEKYKDWMRFVWNIIVDPNIRNVPAMINAMKFIKEVAKGSADIINFLCTYKEEVKQFKAQFEEEIIKARLIKSVSDDSYEKSIIEAESNKLFKGNIRCLLIENEKTLLADFDKNKQIAFEIFKNNDLSDNKPENYLPIRAILGKAEDIKLSIDLSNGRFDNWRFLINSALMEAFQNLIVEIKNNQSKSAQYIMEDICINYQRKDSLFWIYPLVHWVGEKGETLLGNYSDTRKVEIYNNYGRDSNNVYLYFKIQWNSYWDNNLILSNYRNEIITKLVKIKEVVYSGSNWTNIQNQYFRGLDIKLTRKVEINNEEIEFEYFFDRQFVHIRIRETEELKTKFPNLELEEKKEGWIFQKEFNYIEMVKQENDIDLFLKEIEDEFKLLLTKLNLEIA
jgi:hypothetical protein